MNRGMVIFLVGACLLSVSSPVLAAGADKQPALFEIEQNGKTGFIDAGGRVVVEPQFDSVRGRFQEGFIRVEKDGMWGYMNPAGKVMALRYEGVDDFEEGRGRVKGKKGMGFVDHAFTELIPPVYEDAGDFHEGVARIKKDGKWGFIDLNGKVIVPPQFKDADDFAEGVARVKVEKRWGYINKQGKVVVEPRFRDADSFKGGLARVKTDDDRPAYINKKGVIVWQQTK